MELPIQVAVRIFPCATQHPPLKYPKNENTRPCDDNRHVNATTLDERQDENGNENGGDCNYNNNSQNNSNINNNTNASIKGLSDGVANEAINEELKNSKERNANAIDERSFVQAIPLAATAPGFLNKTSIAVPAHFDGGIASGLIQVGHGAHSYPVTHALRADCTQAQIYYQTVYPLICLFLEGFDASIVTFGQKGMGKTYTLYGPGFDCVYGEADQGIVQRCVREIFNHMANRPERKYAVNVAWVEIGDEELYDLLDVGSVYCPTITDVFHWLQVGMDTRHQRSQSAVATHTLFTLTLEQQWVTDKGLIQHRLSTASFSDLCGSQRVLYLDKMQQARHVLRDPGLQALEVVVSALTDPPLLQNGVKADLQYNSSLLTTLLKDSFGGRAQTLVLLCVSPLEQDVTETLCNLQFAFKVQCVRNYVIVNKFSDDNTPIRPDPVTGLSLGMNDAAPPPLVADNFGLQFAANQWFKLVANAEGLLSKLVSSDAISVTDKEQIEEWLFLKQECEECMSSNEALRATKQLVPIEEAEEPEETVSEPETSCQQNSDNESDAESQQPDLDERLDTLMVEFRRKTDTLVTDKYNEFMEKQPLGVMESQDSLLRQQQQEQQQQEQQQQQQQQHQQQSEIVKQQRSPGDERKASIGGRRRSLQPGAMLSTAEIAMLNRVASREQNAAAAAAATNQTDKLLAGNADDRRHTAAAARLRAIKNSPCENLERKLRKLEADIGARQTQLKEMEETMKLKQSLITELVKNSEMRSHAKHRFNKKKAKLQGEYERVKKQFSRAVLQNREKSEVERLHDLLLDIDQRMHDVSSIKHIASESGPKVKKLQQSVHDSKKQIDDLHKLIKKERKVRDEMKAELRTLRDAKDAGDDDTVGRNNFMVKLMHADDRVSPDENNEFGEFNLTADEAEHDDDDGDDEEHGQNLRARISHLDHVLREKSANLKYEGNEGLRHEIRNLRRTRDILLDKRITLDRKKHLKVLSQREERKLLECEEAIEAIDAAIEFKNELICGHKSIDTSERSQREKGEKMLMARLNKLTIEEMRTLLYKYFVKVIDLRDSARKLEVQNIQLEQERESWEWKERMLSNSVRQARLEGERNVVLLQRQHEMKLTLLMRHLAEETSASSASYSDGLPIQQHHQRYGRGASLALANATPMQITSPATNAASTSGTGTGTSPSDSEFDENFYKTAIAATTEARTHSLVKSRKHAEMEICPLPADVLAKYKPLDKLKEKERDTKNKLFAKFQVLTRYAGQTLNSHAATSTITSAQHEHAYAAAAAATCNKADEKALAITTIPQENLKRLIIPSPTSVAKVTRQKNKIIIQDATRTN